MHFKYFFNNNNTFFIKIKNINIFCTLKEKFKYRNWFAYAQPQYDEYEAVQSISLQLRLINTYNLSLTFNIYYIS